MNRFALSILLVSLLAVPLTRATDEEVHAAHHPGTDQNQGEPASDV